MNLTGMLLYRNGVFLQVLEGPQEAVEKVANRIRFDTRHKQFKVLMEGPIQNLSGLTSQDFPGYSEFLNDGPNRIDFVRFPHKAHRLPLSFRESTDYQ